MTGKTKAPVLRPSRARIIIRYALLLLAAAAVLTVGGAVCLLDYALRPGGERGKDAQAAWHDMFARYEGMRAWHDSLVAAGALRDTSILSADGKDSLHAYYLRAPRPTRRTALVVHGYTDNAVRMMMIGRMYNRDLGYNVLLPDLRRAGGSSGSHVQMGWLDRYDVEQWGLSVLPRLFGDSATVVVHGISMGAATVMMMSGDYLPTAFRAFVEDCGYTSVEEQFRKELRGRFGLPSFPLLPVASALCRLRYGWSFGEASALKQVSRCSRPMLFIHGGGDDFVPTRMVYELYAAHRGVKALWVAPGSAHALSYRDYPEEYTRCVREFITPWM